MGNDHAYESSGDQDISKDLMKDSEFINELAQKISRTDKSINHVSNFLGHVSNYKLSMSEYFRSTFRNYPCWYFDPRFEIIHV